MKAFKALTIMIEMADSVRDDIPQEMRHEMSEISEELIAMRNRYSQIVGIPSQLPCAEEMEIQS